MLPAFETLGKPQELEVVVARHAGSVFGQMLQACGARSLSNLISDGVAEVRFMCGPELIFEHFRRRVQEEGRQPDIDTVMIVT
jgi:hypothetical protein